MSTPYEPELPTDAWLAVRDFVTTAVEDSVERTPYNAKDLMLACGRLAVWADRSAGLPIERDVLFRREIISEFIATGLRSFNAPARGNIRSQLLRVSEALLDRRDILRRLPPLPGADPARPYTPLELISLRSWASGQSTPSRRTNAAVLLAAGAGAGLSASEIGNLRARDIQVDKSGVVLSVAGGRARRVPVLGEWVDALRERVDHIPPECFAFRENHTEFYPNLVSNFVARSGRIGVKPQTQRLRATWIVVHLTRGTPVGPLMRAAGVDSLEAFTRYVRFVPALGEAEFRATLSGGEGSR